MEEHWCIPPIAKEALTSAPTIAARLQSLVGQPFPLTGKTRTDGTALRHLAARTLDAFPLPAPSPEGHYQVVPPKRKGVPRMLREFVETYLITTGTSYNLQVWNRNPAADSVQVEYTNSAPLLANDVRFIFVRVHSETHRVRCVVVLSPDYIERRFGRFGKQTVKQQLIITPKARASVLERCPPILFYPDLPEVRRLLGTPGERRGRIRDAPVAGSIRRLEDLRELVERSVIGAHFPAAATKNRGQALESLVSRLLGHEPGGLVGGYPDVASEALEVKVQDAPTVDLGKFTPQFDEPVPSCPGFTTRSIRYLIALTNAQTGVIEGAFLGPGARLGDHFTYVADSSFKSQRSIPMSFFDSLEGQSVFNPD